MCTYSVEDLIFSLPVHRFGSVFLWDSGSSVGNIDGHTSSINAVDYKPTRPFRICTGSEDREVGFFEGPPFKFHHMSKVGSKNTSHCNEQSNLFLWMPHADTSMLCRHLHVINGHPAVTINCKGLTVFVFVSYTLHPL